MRPHYAVLGQIHRSLWLLPILLALSLPTTQGAFAQLPSPNESGARAASDELCTAGLFDRDAFGIVLSNSERERIALNRKMIHSRFSYGPSQLWNVTRDAARRLTKHFQDNLARLDVSYGTAALILTRHEDHDSGGSVLCAWLLTPTDLGLHHFDWPDRIVPQLLADLGVTAMSEARAPVRRNALPTRSTAVIAPLPPEETQAALERVSRVILSPSIKNRIADGQIRRLLIFAEDSLSTVPFAALPIRDGRSLVEFASVVVMPDVDVLIAPRPRSPYNFTGQKLIVGDPDFSADKNWTMNQLPEAKAEAIEVAQRFGASALTGTKATHQEVLTQLRTGSIELAYFATHGVADGVDPMDGSFLALSFGQHLLAREIKQLKFQRSAPLVVMSACETGWGKVFRGGVFGLARAWYFAGAPQIVMSLWSVDDKATKALMVAFMSHMAASMPAEYAMQQAMIETKSKFSSVALWAGFSIYGQPTAKSVH